MASKSQCIFSDDYKNAKMLWQPYIIYDFIQNAQIQKNIWSQMVNNLYYNSGSCKSVGLNHSYCLDSVSRYEGHIHDKEYTEFLMLWISL